MRLRRAVTPIPQPIFLCRDFARQLVVFQLFFFEHLVAPGLEFGKAPVTMEGDAAIEPKGLPGQILEGNGGHG